MNNLPHVTIGQCSAEVIEASDIAGSGLVTFRLTYPRFIHAEVNTHRVFSRNASSSRAIPAEKQRSFVEETPVCPDIFTKSNTGMEAKEAWEDHGCVKELRNMWKHAGRDASIYSNDISLKNVSKQVTNRLLEPFLPITTIVTSSKWSNFFHLRVSKDADPQMQILAYCILKAYKSISFNGSSRIPGIHAPFVGIEEYEKIREAYEEESMYITKLYLVSAGRCARVSYLTRRDTSIHEDVSLANKLITSGHMSPFEHFAKWFPVKSLEVPRFLSNLNPIEEIVEKLLAGDDEIHMWVQARKMVETVQEKCNKTLPSIENLSGYVQRFIKEEELKGATNA